MLVACWKKTCLGTERFCNKYLRTADSLSIIALALLRLRIGLLIVARIPQGPTKSQKRQPRMILRW